MTLKFFDKHRWQNRLKYQPLAQRLFLLFGLSCRYPKTLNIEPTNLCNLSCVFCPVKTTNRPKGFMRERLFREIINQITEARKIEVLWLNKDGEPLLHPKIDWLVEYAKRKKAADRIEIYTNGLLLDQKMSAKLIKAQLDSLVISLDAVDRDSFIKLKRVDGYDQVASNIYNFLKVRKKLGVSKPLLSVKTIDFGNDRLVRKFKRTWEEVADEVIFQPLHEWEGSLKFKIQKSKFKINKRYPCNLPWLAPAVFWDGKMVSCCVNFKKNELVMGDLAGQSLAEVWQGEKYRRLRRAHLGQNFVDWPTCGECQFWQQLPNMSFWLKRLGVQ